MRNFDWRNARNPLVQELGWCLFSEPIVDQLPPATSLPWPCSEDRGAREILAALDHNPTPLQQHLAGLTDKRLGARFEAMWTFYLSHHPQFELLAHNWPIQKNGQTLGALDLLFRDYHLNTVIHGEIAVKFFLYYPDHPGTGLQKWIGPNPDDSLADKITHLTSHQLPLSAREETLTGLQKAGLPGAQQRACVIKGLLFHPWRQRIPLPSPFNQNHLCGEWLPLADLPALLASNPHCRWNLLDKQQWLLPKSQTFSSGKSLGTKMAERLKEKRQPVMICNDGMASNPTANRYLVLPPDWPRA